jgi:hypothetical protein
VEQVIDEQTQTVTAAEACEIMNVTPANLRQLKKRGHLQPQGRQGKQNVFFLRDVLALAEKRQTPIKIVPFPEAVIHRVT